MAVYDYLEANKINMTSNLRAMRIYDIEKDYQRHKQRLFSIQTINSRRKVCESAVKNAETVNLYKRQKMTADIFNEREKTMKLLNQNVQLHKTLSKVYARDKSQSNVRLSTSRSSRSLSSQSRIKEENTRFKNKIMDARSTLERIRPAARKKSISAKDQMIKFLEQQLGIKPSVVFPVVKQTRPRGYPLL